MQKRKDTLLAKLNDHLYCTEDEMVVHFDTDEQDIVIRIRDIHVKMLNEFWLPDRSLVQYMVDTYDISEATAYRDLGRCKLLLGDPHMASKEHQRYRADQMVTQGYQLAKEAKSSLEVKQADSMIRAAQAMVKIHKLDKEEPRDYNWDEYIPIELVPTDDVSVMPGYKRKYEDRPKLIEAQNRMRKKYGQQPLNITNAKIV